MIIDFIKGLTGLCSMDSLQREVLNTHANTKSILKVIDWVLLFRLTIIIWNQNRQNINGTEFLIIHNYTSNEHQES